MEIFFFQAEDGIRDDLVTGVQTCALPISTCATNIVAAIRGGQQSLFAFEGRGTLGSLGHGSAVAQILGVKISGWLAWFLWRCIYLAKIPGIKPKVRISMDWLVHLPFPPDLAQTRVDQESG